MIVAISLNVVAIYIERGGSPHNQFNSFTFVLFAYSSHGFAHFRLLVRIACAGVRVETSLLLLFRSTFVYTCEVSSLILMSPYAATLLGSVHLLLSFGDVYHAVYY